MSESDAVYKKNCEGWCQRSTVQRIYKAVRLLFGALSFYQYLEINIIICHTRRDNINTKFCKHILDIFLVYDFFFLSWFVTTTYKLLGISLQTKPVSRILSFLRRRYYIACKLKFTCLHSQWLRGHRISPTFQILNNYCYWK